MAHAAFRVAPLAWLPVAAAVAGATQTNLTLFAAPADAGYKFYRIPALLRVPLSAGEAWLLAFAEGRQQGTDHGRVDLVLKRSADDGATWSPLAVVHTESTRERGETIGNPTPLWDEESGEEGEGKCDLLQQRLDAAMDQVRELERRWEEAEEKRAQWLRAREEARSEPKP